MIEVPSETYISIVSQYMSTVMELAFDNSIHRVAAYTKGRFGIIDVGGETILVNSTIYMMPFPIGSESFEGVNILIKEIGLESTPQKYLLLNKFCVPEIQKMAIFIRPIRMKWISGTLLQSLKRNRKLCKL